MSDITRKLIEAFQNEQSEGGEENLVAVREAIGEDSSLSDLRDYFRGRNGKGIIRILEEAGVFMIFSYEKANIVQKNNAEVIDVLSFGLSPFEKGRIFLVIKDYEEAEKHFLDAVKQNPQHCQAWNHLASIYGIKKQYQRAEDCCNKALDIDSYDPTALRLLGMIQLSRGKFDEAEKYCRESISKAHDIYFQNIRDTSPEIAAAYCGIGQIRIYQGRHIEAAAYYEEAVRYDPREIEAFHGLIDVRKSQERYSEIATYSEKAKACEPRPYDLWTVRNDLIKND